MAEFYDWHKTLSYDADVTMVVGARGIGKTFGLRKQCIKDFLKCGPETIHKCVSSCPYRERESRFV